LPRKHPAGGEKKDGKRTGKKMKACSWEIAEPKGKKAKKDSGKGQHYKSTVRGPPEEPRRRREIAFPEHQTPKTGWQKKNGTCNGFSPHSQRHREEEKKRPGGSFKRTKLETPSLGGWWGKTQQNSTRKDYTRRGSSEEAKRECGGVKEN